MIKKLVFDIDGTISTGNNEMSTQLKYVLQVLQNEYGITYMLASGRPYLDILTFIEKQELHCDYIMMNGAMVMDDQNTVVLEKAISTETILSILTILSKHKIPFACYGVKTSYCLKEMKDIFLHNLATLFDCAEDIELFSKAMTTIYDLNDIQNKTIFKIEAIMYDEKRIQKARKELVEVKDIQIVSSLKWNIEITDKHANKGETLQEYAKAQGYKDEEIMVFGDSENDATMFEKFENSVFVNNDEGMKYETKYSTDSCRQDGVTTFLKQYFSI